METIVADLSSITFKIEHTLNRQIGLGTAMFAGMDKSNAEKCKYFLQKSGCSKGFDCPFRHSRGDKVVCKHWLRGLCKKSDLCEFLHEYDESRMPECYFFSTYNECSNGDECQYRHVDPDSKIKDCPWYTRGFCKHGPNCRHRHTRKVMCQNYICGFCPEGPTCKFAHPRWEFNLAEWQAEEANSATSSVRTDQPQPPQQQQQQQQQRPPPEGGNGPGMPQRFQPGNVQRFGDSAGRGRGGEGQSRGRGRGGRGGRFDGSS